MQPDTDKGESRKRGVGFPQLPLPESVDAVIKLGQHGKSHSQDAAAAYLGHATPNSGAFRGKLASLRDWGLLARGDRDKVVLSELAQQLVLEAHDLESNRQLLLAAFESCRIFGMFYNDSAKDTPLDMQRLRTTAVMRFGVASDQADRFVDSLIQSAVYAGIGAFDGSKATFIERDVVFGDTSADRIVEELPDPTSVASATAVGSISFVSANPVALRQAWPIGGGEIEFIVRTSRPLPPTIYALMAKMAQVAEEMAAVLTEPDPASTTEEAPRDAMLSSGNG
jgi:hypothetical protein